MKLRRALAACILGVGVSLPVVITEALPAHAATCYVNYPVSTGQPGGGVSGQCPDYPYWVQVVGLCQNYFTRSSHWVNGNWTTGVSLARCGSLEHGVGGFVRIGSRI